MPTFQTEGVHAGEHLVSEANGWRSREAATIASGADLSAATVLGKITIGAKTAVGAAGTPAPAGATITAAPTADATTKVGVHIFRCIVGGAGTASKWEHTDPDGEVVGVATAGSVYTGGGLGGLTITDTAADPTAGEAFNVTVSMAAASGKYVQYDQDGTDGRQHAAGVLYAAALAASADVSAAIHVRDCEVNGLVLVWPDDIEAGEKTAAIAELASLGIIVRS